MATEQDSDWLPSGWTVVNKASHGRKYKCYINSETGEKLFSKVAVLRHIENGSIPNKGSPTKLERAEETPGKKQKHIVEEESLGLPSGWTMELRTRKSGGHQGATYKCYIDPSTGSKFYSIPEVYRYLGSRDGSAGVSGQKETRSFRQSSRNRSADPPSCHKSILEPNVSLVSRSADPASRHESILEPNVSQVLVARVSDRLSSGKGKVVVERTVDEELPSGWIKETRIKRRSTVIRRDSFYIDPVTGLVFPSKVGALRYVETGEICKHAFLRKDESINAKEFETDESSPTSSSKRQKTETVARNQFREDEATPKQSISTSPEAGGKRSTRSSSRIRPASVGEVTLKQSAVLSEPAKTLPVETSIEMVDCKENGSAPREREPSSATSRDKLKDDKLGDVVPKGCNNKRAQPSKRKTKDMKTPSLPSRSSKRLAGVETEVVFNSLPIEHASMSRKLSQATSSNLVSISTESQDPQNVHPIQECSVNVNCSLNPEITTGSDLVLQEEQVSPSISQHEASHIKIDQPLEYPGSKSEKSPGQRPISEEQPASVAREIEQPGSEFCFTSPFWADPCLEFAFKTLTGAIPLDDNLAIQDYVQHQLRTSSKQNDDSRTLPDMGLPSSFQNEEAKSVSPTSNGFGSQKSSR